MKDVNMACCWSLLGKIAESAYWLSTCGFPAPAIVIVVSMHLLQGFCCEAEQMSSTKEVRSLRDNDGFVVLEKNRPSFTGLTLCDCVLVLFAIVCRESCCLH